MDPQEHQIKRHEMELHDGPADRDGFSDQADDEHKAALDEIVRVHRADGTLIFREPLKYNLFAFVFRRILSGPCHTEHESPFDQQELDRVLHECSESAELRGHYLVVLLIPFLDGKLPARSRPHSPSAPTISSGKLSTATGRSW